MIGIPLDEVDDALRRVHGLDLCVLLLELQIPLCGDKLELLQPIIIKLCVLQSKLVLDLIWLEVRIVSEVLFAITLLIFVLLSQFALGFEFIGQFLLVVESSCVHNKYSVRFLNHLLHPLFFLGLLCRLLLNQLFEEFDILIFSCLLA